MSYVMGSQKLGQRCYGANLQMRKVNPLGINLLFSKNIKRGCNEQPLGDFQIFFVQVTE